MAFNPADLDINQLFTAVASRAQREAERQRLR